MLGINLVLKTSTLKPSFTGFCPVCQCKFRRFNLLLTWIDECKTTSVQGVSASATHSVNESVSRSESQRRRIHLGLCRNVFVHGAKYSSQTSQLLFYRSENHWCSSGGFFSSFSAMKNLLNVWWLIHTRFVNMFARFIWCPQVLKTLPLESFGVCTLLGIVTTVFYGLHL